MVYDPTTSLIEQRILTKVSRSLISVLSVQSAATAHEMLRHFWGAYPITSAILLNKVGFASKGRQRLLRKAVEPVSRSTDPPLGESPPNNIRNSVSF
jgi:hypothetical protein